MNNYVNHKNSVRIFDARGVTPHFLPCFYRSRGKFPLSNLKRIPFHNKNFPTKFKILISKNPFLAENYDESYDENYHVN